MRKVSFSILLLFLTISNIWSQNTNCAPASIMAPISAQWSIVQSYDWTSIADVTGDTVNICIPDGCFYLYTFANGANWNFNELTLTINNTSIPVQWQYTDTTGYGIAYFEWNTLSGCMDPNACNFDPNATCFDYNLCNYDCIGCTDASASNFSPNATIDNGSCCYSQWVEVTASDSVYLSITLSNGNYLTGGDNYYANTPIAFCFNPGCYLVYVSGLDEDPYTIDITTNTNQTMWSQNFPSGMGNTIELSNNPIYGCMDSFACNYNPNATCNDSSCDYYSCQGCTDSTASNYNPNATIDNGSCCFGPVVSIDVPNEVFWYFYSSNYFLSGVGSGNICIAPGCATLYAYNSTYTSFDYSITGPDNTIIESGNSEDSNIEWDDISTVHIPFSYGEIINGCNDPNACNFNPSANCLDYNLCDYSCQGCTNSEAYNFNPNATVDNGTCCFDLYYNVTIENPGLMGWYVTDGYGQVIAACDNVQTSQGFCSPSNCITFHFQNYMGIPTPIEITLNGESFYAATVLDSFSEWSFNASETVGCADANACNYNPNATCLQYNVCDYSCLGCTDPTAINFNPDATLDNGTCCDAEHWQNIYSTGEMFYYAFSGDGQSITQGYFPSQNGFCMNASCYQLYVYSTDGNLQEITVSNDSMGNYYTFYTQPYLGYNIENIGIDEIAGCTDPLACNYLPNATCDYGYCEYYCGGCTDPQALNYNENALFDDNTCAYQIQAPNVGMQMIPDENNDQFYVMISLTQMGNTYPYAVTNSMNNEMMTMNEIGTTMTGPYSCSDSIQFHIHSLGYNMSTLMSSPVYKMNCNVTNVNSKNTSTLQLFPNPANDWVQFTGVLSGSHMTIRDARGRVIWNEFSSDNTKIISTKNWESGIYFVEIKDNEKIEQFKLQIIH